MAAVAGRTIEYKAVGRVGDSYPVERDCGAGDESIVAPWIIEISDDDYRSFCFPCHALEEAESGSAGV